MEAPYMPLEGAGNTNSKLKTWPVFCILVWVMLLMCVVFMAMLSQMPGGKQQLLLVIDMQKDYDDQSNMELYGYIKTPYHGNISSIVPAINELRQSRTWDKVVFSKDWLDAAELTSGQQSFCIAGTPGAELVNGLDVDSSRDLIFTKNLDDVFNTNTTRPDGHGSFIHGYGLRNEGKRIAARSNRFADVLAKLGYRTEDTIITIAGILTDMCVLKSAMHARDLGFEVQVVRHATYSN